MKFRIVRFLFFISILVTIGISNHIALFSTLPVSFWLPRGAMQIFTSPLFDWYQARWVFWFWRILLILASLGLGGRFVFTLTALVGTLILGQAQSYGYFTHTYMPIVLSLWIWALFPKDPFRLIQLIFALTFAGAGLSKLTIGQEAWLSGDTLYNYLARSDLIYSDLHGWATSWKLNQKLLQFPGIFKFLSLFIITLEISTIWAWLHRKSTRFIILSVLAMQIAIYFTIFVNFQIYLALYFSWLMGANSQVKSRS